MRLVRRVVPTTDRYDGQKLFTRENGKRLATPLFAVLVLIEATDVVFAVDSVPAILAVSREPFIVFAANAFAILGLRSLYFLLGGMQGKFRYLNVGLGVILAFVGVKMLLIGEPFEVHLPTFVSLGVIAAVIAAAVVASLRADARDRRAGVAPPGTRRCRRRGRCRARPVASTRDDNRSGRATQPGGNRERPTATRPTHRRPSRRRRSAQPHSQVQHMLRYEQEVHSMQCPVDATTLLLSERQGVEIDYCPQCRGVWLDRGELDNSSSAQTTTGMTTTEIETETDTKIESAREAAKGGTRPRRRSAGSARCSSSTEFGHARPLQIASSRESVTEISDKLEHGCVKT